MKVSKGFWKIVSSALLGLLLVLTGCAATRVVDIGTNFEYMRDREITLVGTVTRQAVEPREIRDVLEILRFTFPSAGEALPRRHYFFELDDGTGSIWVVTQHQVPPLGKRVRIRGVVREVVALPMLGSYNLVDIAGWKTLLPGEVGGDYILVH